MGQKLQLFFFSSHNSWSLEKERRSLEEPRGHASLAASTIVTPLSSASSTPLMGGSQRVSGSQVGCPKEPLIATSSDQTELYPNILPHRFLPKYFAEQVSVAGLPERYPFSSKWPQPIFIY